MTHTNAYVGIDYSLGKSNVNLETGIHYGVISQHSVPYEYQDDFEQYYGEPTCPKCGNKVEAAESETRAFDGGVEVVVTDSRDYESYRGYGCADYACDTCKHFLDSSEVFSEESLGFSYEQDGYRLANCLDNDIFVLASPFYTNAQFCSPCVPGAGNLDTPVEHGPKTYCLGHDWFEGGKAPYPVFSVAGGEVINPAEDRS